MRIDKIEIGSFGGLRDFSLELGDGLQILIGDNEDGKTTVMAFLKMMFYSKQPNPRELERNLRKKYTPWDGGAMGGAVEFVSGGIRYRLQKQFGDTSGRDKTRLLNLGSGEAVPLGQGEEAGKRFFGLDRAGFERSCFIGQLGRVSADEKGDAVAERLLANLVETGDEGVPQQLVLGRLDTAMRDLVTPKGVGRLDKQQQLLLALYEEKAQVDELLARQEPLHEKQRALEAQIKEQRQREQQQDGWDAKARIEQLDRLLEKLDALETAQNELRRPGMDLPEVEALAETLEVLCTRWRAAGQALDELRAQSGLSGSADETVPSADTAPKGAAANFISEAEFTRADALDNELRRLTELQGRLRPLFQMASDCLESARQKTHAEAALQRAESSYTRLQPGIERATKLEQKLTELEAEIAEIQRALDDRRAQAEAARQVASGRAGRMRIAFAAVAILSGLLSVVISQPLFLLGVAAAAVLFVLLPGRGPNGAGGDEGEAPARLEAMQRELSELRAERTQAQAEAEAARRAKESVREADAELRIAAEAQKRDLRNYQQQWALLCDSEVGGAFSLPKDPEHLDERAVTAWLQGEIDGRREALVALLATKGCADMAGYKAAYLRFQSDAKNLSALTGTQSTLDEQATALCTRAATYQPVDSPEAAAKLQQDLHAKLRQIEELEAETRHLATGMGLSDLDTEKLLCERAALLPRAVAAETEPPPEQGEDEALSVAELTAQLLELQKQLHTPDRLPDQIAAEIAELQESVDEMARYHTALERAQQAMERASDELRQSFGPQLNEATGEILSAITGGRYENVLVAKSYDISVRAGIHDREYAYLSSGTVDQIYLALRLAVSRLISDPRDPLPLFLDDALMQYDDARAVRCLAFLRDYARDLGAQAILFTCHRHFYEKAEPLEIPVQPLTPGR